VPFRSEKQKKFLWLKHPDIAKRWTKEYGSEIVKKAVEREKKKNGN